MAPDTIRQSKHWLFTNRTVFFILLCCNNFIFKTHHFFLLSVSWSSYPQHLPLFSTWSYTLPCRSKASYLSQTILSYYIQAYVDLSSHLQKLKELLFWNYKLYLSFLSSHSNQEHKSHCVFPAKFHKMPINTRETIYKLFYTIIYYFIYL